MALYLLDTNRLSAALNDAPGVRSRIRDLRLRGDRVGTCVPVLCELNVGIALTARRADNERLLRELLRQVRVWPLDAACAQLYGDLYHELRRRGRALSQVDTMLAALAQRMSAVLVTSDRDFEALPAIPIESWLAS